MVASGDVLMRAEGELPPIPEADVVFSGLWIRPEDAQNFGVMFCDCHEPEKLVTFLQKPTPDTIRDKSRLTIGRRSTSQPSPKAHSA
jgi:hypothetical protein